MSQMPLPFEEQDGASDPRGAVASFGKQQTPEDGSKSSEEKKVLHESGGNVPAVLAEMPRKEGIAQRTIKNARWPAGLTFNDALEYTSASKMQLLRWQKSGALTFRRIGRNGAKVALRSQLDELLTSSFLPPSGGIEEDFDFG